MAKKRTPKASETKEKVYLPCKLTEEDLKQRGKQLASSHTSLEVLAQRKKEFNDQIKSQSAGIAAQVALLSQEIQTGIEHKDVVCYWIFDDPQPGDKTLIREDTGEIVRIEEMTEDDLQAEMF